MDLNTLEFGVYTNRVNAWLLVKTEINHGKRHFHKLEMPSYCAILRPQHYAINSVGMTEDCACDHGPMQREWPTRYSPLLRT